MSRSRRGSTEVRHDLVDRLTDWLEREYRDEIAALVKRYPRDEQSLTIDTMDLFRLDPDLVDATRKDPALMQAHLEAALQQTDTAAHSRAEDEDGPLAGATVRLRNVGDTGAFERYVGEFGRRDLGNLRGVKGQVAQLSPSKLRVVEAAYECQRCGVVQEVRQPLTQEVEPHECPGCERDGPFRLVEDESTYRNYQLARLERPPELSEGSGSYLDVHLEGDLADRLRGNERVTVAGELTTVETEGDAPTREFELRTDAGGLEVEDNDAVDVDLDAETVEEIKAVAEDNPIERLVASLAPNLYKTGELETIAEALLLQLCSPPRRETAAGGAHRGDIHVLLLGDPGVGKSDLLEAVEEVAPRARLASGESATEAGMTAAAVKSDFGPTQWTLKPGLLVRSHGGIACLDEVDKLTDQQQAATHQALEAQRIDFSKAGMEATLPAETRMLAAGNPKYGRFDQHEPIGQQLDVSPTLLSRFDLVYLIEDEPDPDHDAAVAEHVLDSLAAAQAGDDDTGDIVDTDLFRAYVQYARERLEVSIPQPARDRLQEAYVDLRSQAHDVEDAPIPVTPRKTQGLARLAEASARARLSETVEDEDVERAIGLIHGSMQDVGMDPETGQFDADIVQTGRSQSQQERVQTVLETVRDLQDENKLGASVAAVQETVAEAIDVRQSRVATDIDTLLENGRLYNPDGSREYVRTT